MMSYDKLSLDSFKKGLQEGKYAHATGARRAVGKASTLSDADKDKARKLIDAHFGPSEGKPTAPKKAAAASTGKGRPKKIAAAAPKKAAAKQAAAAAKPPAAPKKKAGAAKKITPRAPKVESHEHGAAVAQAVHGIDLDDLGSVQTQMRIAEKTIQNTGA